MVLINYTVNGTQVLQPVIYKSVPFYLSIWFYIAIAVVIIASVFILYTYIRNKYRNSLVVKEHLKDKTFRTTRFKNFTGSEFKIKALEKTKDGEDMYIHYKFVPDCVEQGAWGKYIEYDYGILEPIDPKQRTRDISPRIQHIIKFLESIGNTNLLTELLLNSKFKDFVKLMLILILAAVLIHFIADVAMHFMTVKAQCTLTADNQTINTIKLALQNTTLRR